MEVPEVRYVFTDDDVRLAYQDYGTGPATVLVQTTFGHMEGLWLFDSLADFYRHLAANLRILTFDHRGSGMSDGFIEPPTLSDRALDIKAVIDDAGTERVNLIGFEIGAQVAIEFAANHPERVRRLVLMNSRVGRSGSRRARELNPEGEDPGSLRSRWHDLDSVGIDTPEGFGVYSPSLAKQPDDQVRLVPRFMRMVGTRDVFRRQVDSLADLDVVDVAPLIRAPTLVIHVAGNRLYHVGYARLLQELIPGSTLVEFEGDDHMFWEADNWREISDTAIEFITDSDVAVAASRKFAVVLFTDIVSSTTSSMELGDQQWRRRLDTHDRISRRVIADHEGSVSKHTGDGMLATFTMPSQAVAAVTELRDLLADSGIEIRAGLHAGEVEMRGDDISGAVVNLAARVERAAADGDIYATSTVRNMLIGSTQRFEPVGSHQLKGFEGVWNLYRVESTPRAHDRP